MPEPHGRNLYNFTRAELDARLAGWQVPAAHAARLWRYLYVDLAESIDAMVDLPAGLRARLGADTTLGVLSAARATDSRDGLTRKFLLTLADQARIETVLMRYTGRVTACVSSQAGCAMGCVFCATGQAGFTRQLSAGEIVAQAVHVARTVRTLAGGRRERGRRQRATPEGVVLSSATGWVRNVVLMGMGEPMHNYDAVMRAADILCDPNGLAIGGERITISTVGVVPGILRLAADHRRLSLAVSLHAATQDERAALVPPAVRWPLDALMAACRTYCAATGRGIFFEWTLIDGRNDTPEQARGVGRLLAGLPAHLNLIPLNRTSGYRGDPSGTAATARFQQILLDEFSLPSTVRQRRGLDIAAGCGQLAAPLWGRGQFIR